MATYYKTNGEVKEVSPKNGKWFTYEELKEFVGGMIEIVPLPSGKSIVVNEEGKLIGLLKNEKASEEWLKEFSLSEYPFNNGTIAGDALIATDQELVEPEETDGEIDEDVAGAKQNGER